MAPHDHPVFTQVYKWLARAEDAGAIGKARTEVSCALHGRLLVVGLGPAEDLHHLPETVTEVVGIEPSASMRKAAAAAVDAAPMPVEVIDAMGEQLPLPDNSVDSALFAYVLCSVEDPELVIAEALRVLRPGGTIAVLEHVKAREGTWMRRAQRLASPVWPHLAGVQVRPGHPSGLRSRRPGSQRALQSGSDSGATGSTVTGRHDPGLINADHA